MSRSVRAITQSPYYRHQASQQTQEATFAINVVEDLKLYWNSGTNYTKAIYDIGPAITNTSVHLQLSNSFELWRINSVTIKFQLKTFSGDIINLYEDTDLHQYIDFYTAVRRGKQTDQTLEDIEANSSFEQVTWPVNGLGPCSPMKRVIQAGSLRYASTKMTAPFPFIVYGLRISSSNHLLYGQSFQTPFIISMQIQAKCSYKGVRLDKSYVLTKINPNVVQPVVSTTWFIPTISKMIFTKGLYGPDPDESMDLFTQPWTYIPEAANIDVERGQAIIIVRPDFVLPNVYNITGFKNPRNGTTTSVRGYASSYYTIVPNIFASVNPDVYLYLYETNGKLVVSLWINKNFLPTDRLLRVHADMQKIKDLIVSQ